MQPSIMSGRMKFLDRQDELSRLDKLARSSGLAVVFGRRRVGKTRLLLEWGARHDGVYFVDRDRTFDVFLVFMLEGGDPVEGVPGVVVGVGAADQLPGGQ